jgi:hypothetical protein
VTASKAGLFTEPERDRATGQSAQRTARAAILSALGVFTLGLALVALYLPAYATRHLTMPLGFDASWYVWRAQYVAARGIGSLGTAVRPGHALVASILAALTDRSQLELAVVFPIVLVSVFALALGAFARTCFGGTWRSGVATAVVGGALLGATRLVGENVANLMNLALVVAGVTLMARSVAGKGGAAGALGAVAVLVAAGLAHWVFLAVAGAALLLTAALAVPISVRQVQAQGRSALATETGVIGTITIAAGAVMALLIGVVLRARFQTFELREDARRFVPKFRTDLSRLALPALVPVSFAGAVGLASGRVADEGSSRASGDEAGGARGFGGRLLLSWTVVMAAGMAFGALTLDLPPHRFLALLVAVPGAMGLAGAARWTAMVVHRLAGRMAGLVGLWVAVAALTIPGALGWYLHGPQAWMDPEELQQASMAGRYVQGLPHGAPVVFVVSPLGQAGVLSVPLKERIIRIGVPPDRESDVHVFPGDPRDLLAGRRTRLSGVRMDRATIPYWEDVRTALSANPAIVVLSAFGAGQYREAVDQMGATVVGSGVAVLRGPPPARGVKSSGPSPRPVQALPVAMAWAAALLALLTVAGGGWARVVLGPTTGADLRWLLSPAVGVAVLTLGGLVVAKAGFAPGGAVGVGTFAVLAVAGDVAAWVTGRQAGRSSPGS